MVVPPETVVQSESKILGREAVGDRLSGDSEGSGGNNPSSCEENDLCFRRVKGEAARRAPRDKTVESMLDPAEKDNRIRPTTKDRTVVRKGHTKGGTVIDEC